MGKLIRALVVTLFAALAALPTTVSAATRQWTAEQANEWWEKQPWFVGANFGPSNAINQLEMWQPDTFDLKTIDRELGWAEDLGFTSMRVFLHHLLWEQDKAGFRAVRQEHLGGADSMVVGTK